MAVDYDYDQLFPGRFLKSGEFGGREVTLKISGVELEELPDKKGTKVNKDGERVRVRGIISFTDPKTGRAIEKQLVLNRTNGEALKAMFGRKTSAWIGKRVTFYPAVVEAFGEETTAIRVRGSPDIAADITFTAQIGRKQVAGKVKRTVVQAAPAKANTDGKPAAAAAPTPPAEPSDGLPPGLDDAPETPADELEEFTQGFTGN